MSKCAATAASLGSHFRYGIIMGIGGLALVERRLDPLGYEKKIGPGTDLSNLLKICRRGALAKTVKHGAAAARVPSSHPSFVWVLSKDKKT